MKKHNDITTEHPLYTEIKSSLEFLSDMWRGKDAWCTLDGLTVDATKAFIYLPPSEAELAEYNKLKQTSSYYLRLKSSFYENFFKDTIVNDFTGLLSNFTLYDAPPTLTNNINNVDRNGSSLNVFLQNCDNFALRDGLTFILVDYPITDNETPVTELEAMRLNLYPSLKIIPRIDLINAIVIDNVPKLIVYKEKVIAQIDAYKSELVDQYSEYRLVNGQVIYKKFQYIDGELSLVAEGVLRKMSQIPIVPYSYSANISWFTNDFPMMGLAELSLSYYRIDSDLREILHLCKPTLNINVALDEYLKLSSQSDQIKLLKNFDAIATGPRHVIRGDARWLEVSGNVIAPTMTKLSEIETRIKEKSLAFKTGISKITKTATEVNLDAARSEAWLSVLGEKKESLFTSLMEYWLTWTGEKFTPTMEVEKSVVKPKYQFTMPDLLEVLASGGITEQEFREILANNMYIPNNFSKVLEDDELEVSEDNEKPDQNDDQVYPLKSDS